MIDKGYYPEAWEGKSGKFKRQFPVELLAYAQEYSLLEKINQAIKNTGGTLTVTEDMLFDGYENIKKYVNSLRDQENGFKRKPLDWRTKTTGGFERGKRATATETIEIPRSQDGMIATFVAFGPLTGTIFTGIAKCIKKAAK
jgi:hypothetical protein